MHRPRYSEKCVRVYVKMLSSSPSSKVVLLSGRLSSRTVKHPTGIHVTGCQISDHAGGGQGYSNAQPLRYTPARCTLHNSTGRVPACVCIYTHTYICICVFTFINIYMCVCIYTHIYMYVCIYIRIYIHTYKYYIFYIHMYIHYYLLYIHMYISIYVYIYICLYVYIHIIYFLHDRMY
jgi:hypothetical protein